MLLFEGVVEDRHDPLMLGRVRVRVFGKHSDSLAEIPTDHLFWASVLMPVTSASTSGVGQTPGLVEGSHVVGYFRDGLPSQDPVILGSILGIPVEERVTGKGFNDPRTDLQQVPGGKAYPRWVNEPDTSRLARNEKSTEETILSKKSSQKLSDIPTSIQDGKFSQPDSPYGAKYPYNKVMETESGHVVEYDDTPGAERIHIAHKSGTFIEMHPDGTIVCRTTKDSFNLVDGVTNQYSKGTYNLTIDVTGNVYCKGNYTFKTDGDMTFAVKGNVLWNVEGNVTENVKGNVTENVDGNVAETVKGKLTQAITGDMESTAANVKMTGNSAVNITGSSTTTIKGGATTEQLNSNYSLTTSNFSVSASKVSFA